MVDDVGTADLLAAWSCICGDDADGSLGSDARICESELIVTVENRSIDVSMAEH
jgi:hypothetical protein